MIGIWVLAHREVLRFVRQPVRLFGSLVQPLLFWLFMGAGFSQSFSMGGGGTGYREFFFPGIVLMLMLFAAIFSTITLIEDRNAGFLQDPRGEDEGLADQLHGLLVGPLPAVRGDQRVLGLDPVRLGVDDGAIHVPERGFEEGLGG